jgi:hypothetical protein
MNRRVLALLAAAALPAGPLLAQDTATQPTATETSPPPTTTETTAPIEVQPTPTIVTTAPPAATTPAPATAPPPAAAEVPAPRPTATTRTTTTRTTTSRTPAAAPVRGAAPAPTSAPEPAATLPPPIAEPPAGVQPSPEVLPVETVPTTTESRRTGSFLPWLLGGLVLLGALIFFARRRRRDEVVYDALPEERVVTAEPVAAVPLAVAPLAATAADEQPAALSAGSAAGRPWLELLMRPVRAGVAGDEARVEFELIVDNQGESAARDVRVSTWMFAAGSPQDSEMERMLIEPPADASLPEVTIDAGDGKRIQATVALPTAEVDGDAVLPVVVADAHYRLPDGSEGRTSARFAVGVPDGDDLAYFAIDHPSGLHDDVEARPRGELQRV